MAMKPTENIEILGQIMWGSSQMGYPAPYGRWLDVNYRAAYFLVSHKLGDRALITGRLDTFYNEDEADPYYGNTEEEGWAATAAVRRTINDHTQLFLEALRIQSGRPSRALTGDAAHQTQTVLQASTRISF
jgi:hypothetical protein